MCKEVQKWRYAFRIAARKFIDTDVVWEYEGPIGCSWRRGGLSEGPSAELEPLARLVTGVLERDAELFCP